MVDGVTSIEEIVCVACEGVEPTVCDPFAGKVVLKNLALSAPASIVFVLANWKTGTKDIPPGTIATSVSKSCVACVPEMATASLICLGVPLYASWTPYLLPFPTVILLRVS